ncbi:MAG: DUF418 domain-containing protein [Acidobacteria bacterium]|nr:DUF418 domain-containing protein [Acidobacteriota bacterium]
MSSSAAPVPLSSEERSPLIDALRGFALCGILVINIKGFSGFELSHYAFPDVATRLGPGTDAAEFVTKLLVEGKFYSIFSFLFGVGFSIQLVRGEGKPGWMRVYARRLRLLFLLGAIHAFLLWYGDILWIYALLGFALLPFRNLQPRVILACAFALLLAPVALYGVCYLIAPGFNTDDLVPNALDLRTVIHLYATATYPVVLGVNLEDLMFTTKWRFFTGRFFNVLGMFLLGLWAGRLRILHEPEQHCRLLRGVFWVGLVLGLTGSLIYSVMPTSSILTPHGIYKATAYASGVHPLGLAYIAAFVLLWQHARSRRSLSRLVPMGRMALTNYLAQTLLGLAIYYGYGLGWYGRMPILVTMLVVVPSILLAELLLSAWWLRHFRYGPMEWIWRQATYRRRLPLRVAPAPAAAADGAAG